MRIPEDIPADILQAGSKHLWPDRNGDPSRMTRNEAVLCQELS